MAKKQTTLKSSVGATLSTTLDPSTSRHLVSIGDATLTTPGATGFDVITLKTPAKDTVYTAASTVAPLVLGLSHITFKPVVYPEVSGI